MMPSSTALDAPDVTVIVARLRAGDVFTALTFERTEERAAALEAVLREFGTSGTRLVWAGNPLRSPLTIERLLLQIVGPETDLRVDRTPADLARLLVDAIGRESRLLVIVQQPETISPETKEVLGAMAAYLGGRGVQFLFAGSPALRLPDTAPLPPPPTPPLRPVSHMPTDRSTGTRGDVIPIVALLSIVSLGVLLSIWPISRDRAIDFEGEAMVAPQPDLVLSGVDRMRKEFDVFLADYASILPKLSAVQKETLLKEFLTRCQRELRPDGARPQWSEFHVLSEPQR